MAGQRRVVTGGQRLRPYQVEAVDAITSALRRGGRAQAWMACGTGKSLVALHAADAVVPRTGIVAVACPTLGLVAQILRTWSQEMNVRVDALAVCGDDSVADSFVQVTDLPCPVTTDPVEIAAWLRRPARSRRLVVVTHRSTAVLADGLALAGSPQLDLLVVDEAHHTAGPTGKRSGILHQDGLAPARRRLYLTATPRLLGAGVARVDADHAGAVSMDAPDTFGEVAYEYPFSRAIAEDWLDDYRLAVIGVTRPDVLALLRRLDPDAVFDPLSPMVQMAVVQAALGQAARRWGLRRVLAFTPRVADAAEFARTLPRTLNELPVGLAPDGPLWSGYVEGAMTVRQRQVALDRLADPPPEGWTVVANARCLSEGIDIPAVDGVVFTHPKRSTVDIVQAVGRALRRDRAGTGTATVLVPILLPDDPHELTDVGDPANYDTLWQVVRALRAHDDVLAAELDAQRTKLSTGPATLPSRIVLGLPEGYDDGTFLAALTVRLVRSATATWWEGLAAARAFHEREGHLRVLTTHVTDTGFPLGRWITDQRTYRKRGWLPAERSAQLDELGMLWDIGHAQFTRYLAAARGYHGREGHLNAPQREVDSPSGLRLGSWLTNQRQNQRRGLLTADRAEQLQAIDPLWDQPMDSQRLAVARAYHARTGTLRMPSGHHEQGVNLAAWLTKCREQYQAGTLDSAIRSALDAMGMVWQRRTSNSTWSRGLAAARAFHAREGHLDVPRGCEVDGLDLDTWLQNRRHERRRGSLSTDRVRALDALGTVWEPYDEEWQRGLAALQAFAEREGHAGVPKGHWENGVQLNAWITRQRREYRQGSLIGDRVTALEKLGLVWDPKSERWAAGISAARAYRSAYGHLKVPATWRDPDTGFRLGSWISNRRSDYARGALEPERITELEQLGMLWRVQRG